MILTELLKDDCLIELSKAILNNSNYDYQDDELSIHLTNTDNSTNLEISYIDTSADREVTKFKDFLNTLDDDLFIEVCENLNIQEVTDCLNSKNLETVMSGIVKFKTTLREVIEDKIRYYKSFIN